MKVKYSGSVEHKVNTLDLNKVKEKLQNKSLIGDNEMEVIEEMLALKQALDSNSLMTGLWEGGYALGSLPHSREGSAGCLIGEDLFIFGGYSRDLFGDLRKLNREKKVWKICNLNEKNFDAASPRYYHSMRPFLNRHLVIFGGCCANLKGIEIRICFNDLFFYDTKEGTWDKVKA